MPSSEIAWMSAGATSVLFALLFGYLAGWRKGRKKSE